MSGGYVTSIGYVADFYPATAPARLAFAAALTGRPCPAAERPAKVIELGFGQGFGLALLAAANPDVAFEGCDFMAEHVEHARGLARDAGLANLDVTGDDFAAYVAASPEAPDADVIIAHGVMSWIPAADRDAVVEVVRRRLKPGGVFHVSYNCSPGAAPDAPVRDLIRQVAARTPGSPEAQIAAALDVLAELRRAPAVYFAATPVARAHVDRILQADPVYLAHEYLAQDWTIFSVAQMAELLGAAGLRYRASALPPDNVPALAAPQPLAAMLAQAGDPVWRATLADWAVNRAFRRDVFVRGDPAAPEPAPEAGAGAGEALRDWRFILARPRGQIPLQFPGPMGPLDGGPAFYEPILDRLAQGPAGWNDLMALPPFQGGPADLLTECLALLTGAEAVLPLPPGPAPDPAPAQRFNRVVASRAVAGGRGWLASPVGRTGVAVESEETMRAALAQQADASGATDSWTDAWRALGAVPPAPPA